MVSIQFLAVTFGKKTFLGPPVLSRFVGLVVGKLESNAKLNSKLRLKLKLKFELSLAILKAKGAF